jgi:DNA-binding NtrC family response regulator
MIPTQDERPPFLRALRRGAGRRTRDRRTAFAQMLATLSMRPAATDARPLRQVFEEELRRLVPVRELRLREVPPHYGAPPPAKLRSRESITFEVPTIDASRMVVLEATFEPGCGLDDWDFQTLGAARHLASLVLDAERARAGRGLATRDTPGHLIGSSACMSELRTRIERVAATDFTVLIEGASGTGKELVARQIHDMSARRQGPFVAINCAALVETLLEAELFGIEERTATGVRGRRGKFEHADGGTLFLDEVSDLSLSAQAKLLRAIQELSVERVGGHGTRRIDTRIVAATNRSLAGLVQRRAFRSDLFYRLGGVEVQVPALCARRDDILELAEYFLDRHRCARRLQLSQPVKDALLLYDWPGNVRELQRLIERAVALADSHEITLDDLPAAVRGHYATALLPSLTRGDTLRAWAARYAWLVLERCERNKRRTCRALGISYHTLQSHLAHYARLTHAGGPDEERDAPSPAASGPPGQLLEDAERVAAGVADE